MVERCPRHCFRFFSSKMTFRNGHPAYEGIDCIIISTLSHFPCRCVTAGSTMVIKGLDTDNTRCKIDEQDRLDAEEIMVNAMLGSTGTVTSRSSGSPPVRQPGILLPSQRRAGAIRFLMPLSVSSLRRALLRVAHEIRRSAAASPRVTHGGIGLYYPLSALARCMAHR